MKKTILIVDDDEQVRRTLGRILGHHGFETHTADNAIDAVSRAAVERPVAILMDLNLPGIDGLATIALLRSNVATLRIPIVVFTGYSTRENVRAAIDAGASDFVVKGEATTGTLIQRVLRAAARPAPPVSAAVA